MWQSLWWGGHFHDVARTVHAHANMPIVPLLPRPSNRYFLYDLPWISPWIKSISNELDIIFHVIASPLSGHFDVINNRLWRHQQSVILDNETRRRCVKIVVFIFTDSLCRVRNTIMYVLSWRTVYALTRVLSWLSLVSLLRYSENKHQSNPLVSA